ncbi:putative O-methyltransferase [Ophiobolus disseminans]|uniref:Putative O-methyltransferase n=1 Tax=Ophiobolus disseminans TaxID=1469910 RepID=A0A6A7A549_9PLEO|nr:putative O-methyltransferase [Ophiobolus disseminans]
METACQKNDIAGPSMAVGTETAFWSESWTETAAARSRALGALDTLSTLLHGPHGFIHEFVATSWDHGALYAFLQSSLLAHMASSAKGIPLSSLAEHSQIPEDKLLRILALLRCKNIVHEPEREVFTLTAISEHLMKDNDFRAWVEFQLFETRVASAHLAEALKQKPNDYATGSSGFKQGWGAEMYEWHAVHPDKGSRFLQAMRGVAKSLDPADSLLRKHIRSDDSAFRTKVVEIGGRYGFASVTLVSERPNLSFEVRCDSQNFLNRGEALVNPQCKSRISFTHVESMFEPVSYDDSQSVLVYVVRNVLWNWTDEDVVQLLKALLSPNKSTRILVADGVSPTSTQFPPHVELAYRRRDITTMTMHNVKQRTQEEWRRLFLSAHPGLQIRTDIEASSHVCKGLWELVVPK